MNLHLDGLSFRKIEDQTGISKSVVQRICFEQLKNLPDNNKFTFNYCSRFSRIFEFDAKYIPVKGYKNELAFLWGIDYFRHDFPIILLAHSESYQAWAKFCEYFKILNHTPDYIVCDDNSPLKISARYKFPDVKVQTCYNHFKEGIRKSLRVRSDDTYRKFSQEIDIILSKKRSSRDFDFLVHRALLYYMDDPVCRSIIVNLGKRKEEFLAFTGIKNAPVTTNMIEGFNQQLEDRLKPLHHFNSFEHAKLWLNGFVLKRRMTKFKSCKGKFRFLNGKIGVNNTKNLDIDLPTFF